MRNKLIALDFAEHDTIEAAKLLLQMAKDGEIVGLIFVAQLSRPKNKRKVMMGASGRPANDAVVAAGLSAILHCSLTKQALCNTSE